jgi:hypothetical protein
MEITVQGVQELILDLRKLPDNLKEQVILRMSQVAYNEAQAGAGRHIKSGALFQSVFNRQISGGREVGHDRARAPHAAFVIQGTRPHGIAPKNKKALRWAGPNGFIFSKFVNHPGYKGDPYMDNASDKALAQFNTILDTVLRESI